MMTRSPARFQILTAFALLVSCAFLNANALAQKTTLKVGDQAPAPMMGPGVELISGPKVSPFKQGQTYVVEFWATWCAPCRTSIPHINKLYKTYKSQGLHVWGISDEEPDTVRRFVARKGDGMSYSVISDTSGNFNKAYMSAAGMKGIPAAFVVGPSGRVVYIGHPMSSGFDRAIKSCTSGKYDPVLAERAKPIIENLEKATKARDWRMAHRQIDSLMAMDSWVFSDTLFTKYKIYLNEQGDPKAANDYMLVQITETYSNKPDVLQDVVYNLITDPELANADPQLKEQAVAALGQALGEDNPQYLAILALKSHKEGDLSQAVNLQYEAYMAAAGDERDQMRSVLDAYKAEQSRRKGSSKGGRQRR
jgi:peroxiredoxin